MAEWALKRFWTDTTTSATADGYAVLLDGRGVKTPAKTPLVLPTLALAQAVAAEWDAVEDAVDPSVMNFTRSANAALDKVSTQHAEVAGLIAAYGENDLVCYRADGPAGLAARQAQVWDPILAWGETQFGTRLSKTTGVMPVDQPADAVASLRQAVFAQSAFALTALHDLVSLSGSLLIGLAAQKKAFDLAHLWAASRVDEDWQIQQWGDDEEAADQAAKKESAFHHAAKFYALAQPN